MQEKGCGPFFCFFMSTAEGTAYEETVVHVCDNAIVAYDALPDCSGG